MRSDNLKKAKYAVVLCLALAPIVLVSPASGQWEYYDNNADIRALYQRGNTLWVGTNGGLLFVDASTHEVLSKMTAGEVLAGNSVRTIHERERDIIVGTDGGIAVFNQSADGKVTGEQGRLFEDVRHVTFGPTGTMYVSTNGHGVAEVDRRPKWTTKADSLLDNKVFSVSVVDTHKIYYATSLGLCAFLDSFWVSFQAGAGLPRGEVHDLVLLDQRATTTGRIAVDFYVLVAGKGVYRFDGRRARRVSTSDLFVENDIAAISTSPDGALWAVGRYGRIARYQDSGWTRIGEGDEDIDHARWRSVHAGEDGTVFFGSADGLIASVNDGNIRKVFIPSMIPSGYIGSMVENQVGEKFIANGPYLIKTVNDTTRFAIEKDFGSLFAIEVSPDDVVWVSSRWGLFRKELDHWVEVTPDIDSTLPLFVSMAVDSAENLWLGSQDGEIYRFDGALWSRFADRHELTETSIDGLIVDGQRRLWALSRSSGVFKFDGLNWEVFDVSQFDEREIAGFTLGPSGDLFVVTPGKIWTYHDIDRWQVLQTPDTEQVGDFRALCFDTAGRRYLGTSQGVALITNEDLKWVSPRDGLRGKDVTSILVDRDGYLWVGFQKDGMSRILLEKLW